MRSGTPASAVCEHLAELKPSERRARGGQTCEAPPVSSSCFAVCSDEHTAQGEAHVDDARHGERDQSKHVLERSSALRAVPGLLTYTWWMHPPKPVAPLSARVRASAGLGFGPALTAVVLVALSACTGTPVVPSIGLSPDAHASVRHRSPDGFQPARPIKGTTLTASTPAGAELVAASLESRPLDARAVERLVEDARANDSAELVLVKDGELIGDWRFTKARGPIPIMSITKSILSLVIGSLIDRGKLRLDQPVHELYPEWDAGRKRDVTLLHLLTHTSGLDEGKGTFEIYRQRSFVKFTLASDIVFEPGTHYRYSNRAFNLVSGIIGKASGRPTDRYVDEVLLQPLGIRDYVWSRDRTGQAHGLAGLHLLPRDLLKIGELLLHEGAYAGRQIVSREWVHRSLSLGSATQPTNRRKGLGWTLIPDYTQVRVDQEIVAGWRGAGADEAFIAKTAPLVGRRFDSLPSFVRTLQRLFDDPKLTEWNQNTWQRAVPDARFEFGPIVGAYAEGTLGQYLVIVPRDRLVAVRMRREPKNRALRNDPERSFPDFVERVRGLVEGSAPDDSLSRRSE